MRSILVVECASVLLVLLHVISIWKRLTWLRLVVLRVWVVSEVWWVCIGIKFRSNIVDPHMMTWKVQMTARMNRVTAIILLGSLVYVLILVWVLDFFRLSLDHEALSAYLLMIMVLLVLWLLWLFGIIIILLEWLYHLNILLNLWLDIRILFGYGLFRWDDLLRLDDLLLCNGLLLDFFLNSSKIIFIICDLV